MSIEIHWERHHELLERLVKRIEQLIELQTQIMATASEAIKAFAAATAAFNDRIDTAVTDLQGDVKNLQDQIAVLQSSSGQISRLHGIQARASSVADKLDALDALTPPVAPPTPTA